MECGQNECNECNQYSGDIAGPGVRVSFYLQNFLLVLLVDRSYVDAPNALWTFIATSFGLTVAAVVQAKVNQLSLLEGILVSQLSWFANIGTFLALASYSRSKGDDNVVKVAAVLQGYFSIILTILMWACADSFGPTSCDFDLVILFGWELPALRSGRKVALVFASLTIVVYTFVTFIEFRAWRNRGSQVLKHKQDVEMATKTTDRERRGSSGSGHVSRRSHLFAERRRPPGRRRTKWLRADVDPIFFGIIVSQLIILAYFITTTELIIERNNAHSDDSFGFGQVLALTVVIPSFIALYHAMRANRIAPRGDKQRREDEKQRARENLFPAPAHESERHSSRDLSRSLSPPSPRLALPTLSLVDGAERPGPRLSATDVASSLYSNSTSH